MFTATLAELSNIEKKEPTTCLNSIGQPSDTPMIKLNMFYRNDLANARQLTGINKCSQQL